MVTEADDWDVHWAGLSASAEDNPAQHFRHRLVARFVSGRDSGKVLDIGSGQGDLLSRLAVTVNPSRLFGLELSQVGVTKALEKVPDATVLQVDLLSEHAPAKIESIQASLAVCCEVLEHLDDPAAFLESAKVALAPGAIVMVTVPGGPQSAFDKLIGHRRHYSPAELGELLEGCGFRITDAYGAGFPFFNLYRLVVIARGDRLVDDVGGHHPSAMARLAMRTFSVLLRLNVRRSRWGWQTIVVATAPE